MAGALGQRVPWQLRAARCVPCGHLPETASGMLISGDDYVVSARSI